MICINTNKTIFLYDFSSNKANELKVDNQPELLSMVPGGDLMLAIDQDSIKVLSSASLQVQSVIELKGVIECATGTQLTALVRKDGSVYRLDPSFKLELLTKIVDTELTCVDFSTQQDD